MKSSCSEAGDLFHRGLCLESERSRLGRPKVGLLKGTGEVSKQVSDAKRKKKKRKNGEEPASCSSRCLLILYPFGPLKDISKGTELRVIFKTLGYLLKFEDIICSNLLDVLCLSSLGGCLDLLCPVR